MSEVADAVGRPKLSPCADRLFRDLDPPIRRLLGKGDGGVTVDGLALSDLENAGNAGLKAESDDDGHKVRPPIAVDDHLPVGAVV